MKSIPIEIENALIQEFKENIDLKYQDKLSNSSYYQIDIERIVEHLNDSKRLGHP